jgi:hypothetical protein
MIIICGFLTAMILGAVLWPREREPEYDGVLLSEWLERYSVSASGYQRSENFRAIQAIQRIGTNAIPFFLRWIQYETPGWRKFLNSLAGRLPVSVKNVRAVHWLLDDKAEHRADVSADVFWFLPLELGPTQDPVKELLPLARNPRAPKTQSRAKLALMNMSLYPTPNDLMVE